MEIERPAIAGTLESSDIMIEVFPHAGGVDLELTSTVLNQYGDDIRRTILEVVDAMGAKNARIRANDHGALECAIRARVETALLRAGKEGGR